MSYGIMDGRTCAINHGKKLTRPIKKCIKKYTIYYNVYYVNYLIDDNLLVSSIETTIYIKTYYCSR